MPAHPHERTWALRRFIALPSLLLAVALATAPGAASAQATAEATRIDAQQMLDDLGALAHDSMEGRRTGTPGNERARSMLLEAFEARGIQTVRGERTQAFTFTGRQDQQSYEGLNILGMVEGTVHPDRYIVLTAHYDHLGVQNGQIYNGADDNASGTAAILAIGEWLRNNPPRHSVVLAALDAEEMGLQGARAFIADPPVPLDRIVMNVNLDMVSRSEAGELYAVGTYHYPFLTPLVEEVAEGSPVTLLMGHDSPDLPPGDDWTMASDHGPFHQVGIPFLYFGVEDHPGYHDPSDTADAITPDFYVAAVETILDFVIQADRRGERILESRGSMP